MRIITVRLPLSHVAQLEYGVVALCARWRTAPLSALEFADTVAVARQRPTTHRR
jgi:hypothetical protein